MKTILALTDFSISADYTAHYALHLAQKTEADLLLCNIYDLPTDAQASDEDLGELAGRLSAVVSKIPNSIFRPLIYQCSIKGPLTSQLNEIAAKHQVSLIVVSHHHSNTCLGFLSKNHVKAIIDHTAFPVLVVPYQNRYRNYRQIVFATAGKKGNVQIPKLLSRLAQCTYGRIWITKVTAGPIMERPESTQFFSGAPAVDRPKIGYQIIQNRDTSVGLKKLLYENTIDLLVLIHRKRNLWQKIIKPSITKKLLRKPFKPLLVFPEGQLM